MNKCEECQSKNIKEDTKSFGEESDNVLKIFKCLDCGYEKTVTEHIG